MTAPDRDPRETLARIRAQADAATDGPWSVFHGKRCGTYVTRPDLAGVAREWSLTWSDADAEFIAASRTDVPWLLEQVERRDKALDAVLELHKPIQASMTSRDGVSDVTVCDHCLAPTWPCPTVAAITTPLEEDHA